MEVQFPSHKHGGKHFLLRSMITHFAWIKGAGALVGCITETMDAKNLTWRTREKGRLQELTRNQVEAILK